jgi:hypothetical protein
MGFHLRLHCESFNEDRVTNAPYLSASDVKVLDTTVLIGKKLDELSWHQRQLVIRWLNNTYAPAQNDLPTPPPPPKKITGISDVIMLSDLLELTRPQEEPQLLLVGLYWRHTFLKEERSLSRDVNEELKLCGSRGVANVARALKKLREKNPVLVDAHYDGIRPSKASRYSYQITAAGKRLVERWLPTENSQPIQIERGTVRE